jgi:hypothetical protein
MVVTIRVSPHRRRTPTGRIVTIKGYNQKRNRPRGQYPKQFLKRPTKPVKDTYWLKGKKGKFIGRANRYGTTTAIGIKKKGQDNTRNKAGKKYKRIFGRTKATSSPIR